MERVIPLFIRTLSRGEPVTVYGREKMLDFTYVDDCVDGIVAGIWVMLIGTTLWSQRVLLHNFTL